MSTPPLLATAASEALQEAASSPTDGASRAGQWRAREWLDDSVSVGRLVAATLLKPLGPDGAAAAELPFVRSIGRSASRDALLALLQQSNLLETLADAISSKAGDLVGQRAVSGEELHQKFVSEDGAFTLDYGGLSVFFSGLEGLIGSPNPNLRATIEGEHCARADSSDPFETGNYGLVTTSQQEYWFVVDAEEGKRRLGIDAYPVEQQLAPERRRAQRPLSDFDLERVQINRQLQVLGCAPVLLEELACTRLYTGPLYVRYNKVLRGLGRIERRRNEVGWHAEQIETLFKGNLFTTTLHVINSAIVKLSKLTKAELVWRGVAGGVLPEEFWSPDKLGLRGGCEYAFMSTTTNAEVAHSYASRSGKAGSLFSMRMGMVDRGAEISFLSQYPGEREILFNPLTGLEVTSSKVQGDVLVLEVRLNVNLASLTIEQVVGKRAKLLREIGDGMALEVRAELAHLGGAILAAQGATLLEHGLKTGPLQHAASWFNTDDHFFEAVQEAMRLKRQLVDDAASLPLKPTSLKIGGLQSEAKAQLLAAFVVSGPAATALDLSGAGLRAAGADALAAALRRNDTLRSLNLLGNEQIGDAAATALITLLSDGSSSRQLSNSSPTPSQQQQPQPAHPTTTTTASTTAPRLLSLCGLTEAQTSLSLCSHPLSPMSARLLTAEVAHCRLLSALDLSSAALQPAHGMQLAAALETAVSPTLTSVDVLRNGELGIEAARALFAAARTRASGFSLCGGRLGVADATLAGLGLTDADCVLVGATIECGGAPSLRHLSLHDNGSIGGVGLAALARAVRSPAASSLASLRLDELPLPVGRLRRGGASAHSVLYHKAAGVTDNDVAIAASLLLSAGGIVDASRRDRLASVPSQMPLQTAPPPLHPLRLIDLSSNALGDHGLAVVALAMRCGATPMLEELQLEHNLIRDVAPLGDGALAAAPNLQALRLGHNDVSDRAAASLAEALKGGAAAALRHLTLHGNRVADHAVKELSLALSTSLPLLKELKLHANARFGNVGWRALARTLGAQTHGAHGRKLAMLRSLLLTQPVSAASLVQGKVRRRRVAGGAAQESYDFCLSPLGSSLGMCCLTAERRPLALGGGFTIHLHEDLELFELDEAAATLATSEMAAGQSRSRRDSEMSVQAEESETRGSIGVLVSDRWSTNYRLVRSASGAVPACELLALRFDHALSEGSGGPGSFEVTIPRVGDDGVAREAPFAGACAWEGRLQQRARHARTPEERGEVDVMRNALPEQDEASGKFVLDMRGRARLPSNKNLMLRHVHHRNDDDDDARGGSDGTGWPKDANGEWVRGATVDGDGGSGDGDGDEHGGDHGGGGRRRERRRGSRGYGGREGRLVLILGKVGEHTFNLDVAPPLSCLQAFAIALCTMDNGSRMQRMSRLLSLSWSGALGKDRARLDRSLNEAMSASTSEPAGFVAPADPAAAAADQEEESVMSGITRKSSGSGAVSLFTVVVKPNSAGYGLELNRHNRITAVEAAGAAKAAGLRTYDRVVAVNQLELRRTQLASALPAKASRAALALQVERPPEAAHAALVEAELDDSKGCFDLEAWLLRRAAEEGDAAAAAAVQRTVSPSPSSLPVEEEVAAATTVDGNGGGSDGIGGDGGRAPVPEAANAVDEWLDGGAFGSREPSTSTSQGTGTRDRAATSTRRSSFGLEETTATRNAKLERITSRNKEHSSRLGFIDGFLGRLRAGSGTVNPLNPMGALYETRDPMGAGESTDDLTAAATAAAASAIQRAWRGADGTRTRAETTTGGAATAARVGSLQVLSQRVAFTLSPAQPSDVVRCYIRRRHKGLNHFFFPTYELFLKEGDQFLLAARKRKKRAKDVQYLISTDRASIKREGAAYFGKLKGNWRATEFQVFDSGVKPELAREAERPQRRRLASVTYHRSLRGSRASRKMKVVLPPLPPAESHPHPPLPGMLHMASSVVGVREDDAAETAAEAAHGTALRNRPLRWDDTLAAYVTVINGYTVKASKKNFALQPVSAHGDAEPSLDFQRIGDNNLFTLDYAAPLCAAQAFGIALSSFEASNKTRPSTKLGGRHRHRHRRARTQRSLKIKRATLPAAAAALGPAAAAAATRGSTSGGGAVAPTAAVVGLAQEQRVLHSERI